MLRSNEVAAICRVLKGMGICVVCIALVACGSGGSGNSAATANTPINNNPTPSSTNPVSPSVANAPPSGTGNQPITNMAMPSAAGVAATGDSNPGAAAPAGSATKGTGLSLIAGNIGGPGSLDGTGSAARFFGPSGAVFDAAGNLYVADTDNHTIRKVTASGVVTTLAGAAGVVGAADGAALSARFSLPHGMAFDAAGNLYVADTGNHAIRRISPTGVVSTVAGAPGTAGNADGTGAAARFNSPTDIAIDGAGNFFVTDTDNGLIRKMTPSGAVTTLTHSDGATAPANVQLHGPRGIATDKAGNLYVTISEAYQEPLGNQQSIGSAVMKITAAGAVTMLAGAVNATGSVDGTGSSARFDHPDGLALDAAGNAYVADTQNHTIRKITPAGAVSTLAGTPSSGAQSGCGSADGTGSAARFCNPSSLTIDVAGNLFVTDAANGSIRTISSTGQVGTLAGMAAVFGSVDGTGASARFNTPNGVYADAAGNVYVADLFNGTIRKISAIGVVTTLAGVANMLDHADGSASAAHFAYPFDIVPDAAGNFYVTEELGRTVRKISPAGAVSTLAGQPDESGSADGQESAAQFNSPFGIAADAAGNLYVADEGNCNIRKITPAGFASTLAGGSCGNADGTLATARFSFPFGIALDTAGNIYVADTYNNTIRKITSDGKVSTLAGQAGSKGSADGQGAAARFNSPAGLAVDSAGNVYIADTLNNTIRRITPAGMVSTVAGVANQRGIVLGALPGGLSWPRDVALVNDKTLVVTSENGVLRLTLP